MSEPDDPQTQSRVASRIVWMFGGLVFYVLSIGPVSGFLHRTHWDPPDWFETVLYVYLPLALAGENWPWFGELMDRYIKLFLP